MLTSWRPRSSRLMPAMARALISVERWRRNARAIAAAKRLMLRTLGRPLPGRERPATNRKLCGMNCGLAGWTGSRRAARGPDSRQLVADQRQKHDRAPGERRIGGGLAPRPPGPERAEHDLEQPAQRDFTRGQRAAPGHPPQSGQPALGESQERPPGEGAPR